MKGHTGGRTIDGIFVLVDGEPLSPHADQLKLTDYGSNGAMRAPSLRSWSSRSCSSISATPRRQRASIRASCSGSSPISNNAENDERRHRRRDSSRCAASVPPSSLRQAFP